MRGTVIEVADENSDDSPVTCKKCGHLFGTWGEVKAAANEQTANAAADLLRGGPGKSRNR
jgi:hypothetical protein